MKILNIAGSSELLTVPDVFNSLFAETGFSLTILEVEHSARDSEYLLQNHMNRLPLNSKGLPLQYSNWPTQILCGPL